MLCFSQTSLLQTAGIDLWKDNDPKIRSYFTKETEVISQDTEVDSKFVENILYSHNNITYVKDKQNMLYVLFSTLDLANFWAVLIKEIFYILIGAFMIFFAFTQMNEFISKSLKANLFVRFQKETDYERDLMQLLMWSSFSILIFILYYDKHLYTTADKISTGLLKKFLKKIEDTSYFVFINNTDTILKETTIIISLFQNISKQFPSITKYLAAFLTAVIIANIILNTLLIILMISVFSVFFIKYVFYKNNKALFDAQEVLLAELSRSINRIFADFSYGKIFLNSLKGVDNKIKILQTNIEFLSVKIRSRLFIQSIVEIVTFFTVFLFLVWFYFSYLNSAAYNQRVPLCRASYNTLINVFSIKFMSKILKHMVGNPGLGLSLVIQNTLGLWLKNFCKYAPILLQKNLLKTSAFYSMIGEALDGVKDFSIEMNQFFQKWGNTFTSYHTEPDKLSPTLQYQCLGFKILCTSVLLFKNAFPEISNILPRQTYRVAKKVQAMSFSRNSSDAQFEIQLLKQFVNGVKSAFYQAENFSGVQKEDFPFYIPLIAVVIKKMPSSFNDFVKTKIKWIEDVLQSRETSDTANKESLFPLIMSKIINFFSEDKFDVIKDIFIEFKFKELVEFFQKSRFDIIEWQRSEEDVNKDLQMIRSSIKIARETLEVINKEELIKDLTEKKIMQILEDQNPELIKHIPNLQSLINNLKVLEIVLEKNKNFCNSIKGFLYEMTLHDILLKKDLILSQLDTESLIKNWRFIGAIGQDAGINVPLLPSIKTVTENNLTIAFSIYNVLENSRNIIIQQNSNLKETKRLLKTQEDTSKKIFEQFNDKFNDWARANINSEIHKQCLDLREKKTKERNDKIQQLQPLQEQQSIQDKNSNTFKKFLQKSIINPEQSIELQNLINLQNKNKLGQLDLYLEQLQEFSIKRSENLADLAKNEKVQSALKARGENINENIPHQIKQEKIIVEPVIFHEIPEKKEDIINQNIIQEQKQLQNNEEQLQNQLNEIQKINFYKKYAQQHIDVLNRCYLLINQLENLSNEANNKTFEELQKPGFFYQSEQKNYQIQIYDITSQINLLLNFLTEQKMYDEVSAIYSKLNKIIAEDKIFVSQIYQPQKAPDVELDMKNLTTFKNIPKLLNRYFQFCSTEELEIVKEEDYMLYQNEDEPLNLKQLDFYQLQEIVENKNKTIYQEEIQSIQAITPREVVNKYLGKQFQPEETDEVFTALQQKQIKHIKTSLYFINNYWKLKNQVKKPESIKMRLLYYYKLFNNMKIESKILDEVKSQIKGLLKIQHIFDKWTQSQGGRIINLKSTDTTYLEYFQQLQDQYQSYFQEEGENYALLKCYLDNLQNLTEKVSNKSQIYTNIYLYKESFLQEEKVSCEKREEILKSYEEKMYQEFTSRNIKLSEEIKKNYEELAQKIKIKTNYQTEYAKLIASLQKLPLIQQSGVYYNHHLLKKNGNTFYLSKVYPIKFSNLNEIKKNELKMNLEKMITQKQNICKLIEINSQYQEYFQFSKNHFLLEDIYEDLFNKYVFNEEQASDLRNDLMYNSVKNIYEISQEILNQNIARQKVLDHMNQNINDQNIFSEYVKFQKIKQQFELLDNIESYKMSNQKVLQKQNEDNVNKDKELASILERENQVNADVNLESQKIIKQVAISINEIDSMYQKILAIEEECKNKLINLNFSKDQANIKNKRQLILENKAKQIYNLRNIKKGKSKDYILYRYEQISELLILKEDIEISKTELYKTLALIYENKYILSMQRSKKQGLDAMSNLNAVYEDYQKIKQLNNSQMKEDMIKVKIKNNKINLKQAYYLRSLKTIIERNRAKQDNPQLQKDFIEEKYKNKTFLVNDQYDIYLQKKALKEYLGKISLINQQNNLQQLSKISEMQIGLDPVKQKMHLDLKNWKPEYIQNFIDISEEDLNQFKNFIDNSQTIKEYYQNQYLSQLKEYQVKILEEEDVNQNKIKAKIENKLQDRSVKAVLSNIKINIALDDIYIECKKEENLQRPLNSKYEQILKKEYQDLILREKIIRQEKYAEEQIQIDLMASHENLYQIKFYEQYLKLLSNYHDKISEIAHKYRFSKNFGRIQNLKKGIKRIWENEVKIYINFKQSFVEAYQKKMDFIQEHCDKNLYFDAEMNKFINNEKINFANNADLNIQEITFLANINLLLGEENREIKLFNKNNQDLLHDQIIFCYKEIGQLQFKQNIGYDDKYFQLHEKVTKYCDIKLTTDFNHLLQETQLFMNKGIHDKDQKNFVNNFIDQARELIASPVKKENIKIYNNLIQNCNIALHMQQELYKNCIGRNIFINEHLDNIFKLEKLKKKIQNKCISYTFYKQIKLHQDFQKINHNFVDIELQQANINNLIVQDLTYQQMIEKNKELYISLFKLKSYIAKKYSKTKEIMLMINTEIHKLQQLTVDLGDKDLKKKEKYDKKIKKLTIELDQLENNSLKLYKQFSEFDAEQVALLDLRKKFKEDILVVATQLNNKYQELISSKNEEQRIYQTIESICINDGLDLFKLGEGYPAFIQKFKSGTIVAQDLAQFQQGKQEKIKKYLEFMQKLQDQKIDKKDLDILSKNQQNIVKQLINTFDTESQKTQTIQFEILQKQQEIFDKLQDHYTEKNKILQKMVNVFTLEDKSNRLLNNADEILKLFFINIFCSIRSIFKIGDILIEYENKKNNPDLQSTNAAKEIIAVQKFNSEKEKALGKQTLTTLELITARSLKLLLFNIALSGKLYKTDEIGVSGNVFVNLIMQVLPNLSRKYGENFTGAFSELGAFIGRQKGYKINSYFYFYEDFLSGPISVLDELSMNEKYEPNRMSHQILQNLIGFGNLQSKEDTKAQSKSYENIEISKTEAIGNKRVRLDSTEELNLFINSVNNKFYTEIKDYNTNKTQIDHAILRVISQYLSTVENDILDIGSSAILSASLFLDVFNNQQIEFILQIFGKGVAPTDIIFAILKAMTTSDIPMSTRFYVLTKAIQHFTGDLSQMIVLTIDALPFNSRLKNSIWHDMFYFLRVISISNYGAFYFFDSPDKLLEEASPLYFAQVILLFYLGWHSFKFPIDNLMKFFKDFVVISGAKDSLLLNDSLDINMNALGLSNNVKGFM